MLIKKTGRNDKSTHVKRQSIIANNLSKKISQKKENKGRTIPRRNKSTTTDQNTRFDMAITKIL